MVEAFAFGDNAIQGKSCPVVTATGSRPTGRLLTVAEMYDSVVRNWYGLDEGVLPASVAEACWRAAIDELIESAEKYEGSDKQYSDELYEAVEEGRDIAESVF